ncbi:MAG: response regulator transcription factor [Kiritimatiellae bacterium]|nr:response regulator transcription factor [Kiritimatiellia bacterium]
MHPRPYEAVHATPAGILLVVSHPLLRVSLTRFIDREVDLHVLDAVGDLPAALRSLDALRPNVVVIDTMADGGLDGVREIRRAHPQTPIVVLSMEMDPDYVARAFKAGASGYVGKETATDRLLMAIRQVLKGERYEGEMTAGKTGS